MKLVECSILIFQGFKCYFSSIIYMSLSSISFAGDASSYITVPNSEDINFGTGDFTIEWYQYQTDDNDYPRIFQIGNYLNDGIVLGVSIEGGSFYYWTTGSYGNYVKLLNSGDYKDIWVHFAISRTSGTTQVFMNGTSIFSMSDTNDFIPTVDLTIANEYDKSNGAAFGGLMMYFSIKKGVGLYTQNFTVSNDFPTDYTILIKAGSFGNNVPTNVSTDTDIPPNFNGGNPPPPPPPTPVPRPVVRYYMPLFTNNAQVYYKSNSLPSCGVGSVRNSRFKAKRT